MSSNNIYYYLLIFFLFSFSFQEDGKNWTIENNSINIKTYLSTLKDYEREHYYYYIGLRNSFYYSENSNQLEKLVKYFTPEEKNYYKDLYSFSAPGLVLASIVIIVFFIYLIRRFLFKGCLGPKNVEKSYHYITYFLIAFGCLIGLIFHICTVYNAAKSK